jgi:hypothetical protein
MLVRVPEMFSHFFGDKISENSMAFGAQDQSDVAAKIKLAKEARERRHL